MPEQFILQYFRQFRIDARELYGGLVFDRHPTKVEILTKEQEYSQQCFPGRIGFIDSM